VVLDNIAGEKACYLQRLYEAELEIANRLLEMAAIPPETRSGIDSLIVSISRELGIEYAPNQREAIAAAAAHHAVLLTGGPESLEFAKHFSTISEIRVNPLLVETSPPEWVPQVHGESFKAVLSKICGRTPKRVGVANWNIIPQIIYEDLKAAAPDAKFVPADDILLQVQRIKSDVEIPYIVESYRITEEAMKAAMAAVREGKREWELEAVARSLMLQMGAEGLSYPAWVCSGPNTKLSLCRSTDRAIHKNELIQFTFGAKYMGYCGNMCRPFSIGAPDAKVKKLMDVALEAMHYAINAIRPGVRAFDVFDGYFNILKRYGFEAFTLYGPAHGTGSSEVEGLWLAKQADFLIESNMLFNVDIWLSDGTCGLRYEDGVLVTEQGIRELTAWRREAIIL
jgi:Xaa-Pro aminopeptidase